MRDIGYCELDFASFSPVTHVSDGIQFMIQSLCPLLSCINYSDKETSLS